MYLASKNNALLQTLQAILVLFLSKSTSFRNPSSKEKTILYHLRQTKILFERLIDKTKEQFFHGHQF